jgi:hypothetical protein
VDRETLDNAVSVLEDYRMVIHGQSLSMRLDSDLRRVFEVGDDAHPVQRLPVQGLYGASHGTVEPFYEPRKGGHWARFRSPLNMLHTSGGVCGLVHTCVWLQPGSSCLPPGISVFMVADAMSLIVTKLSPRCKSVRVP